MTKKRIFILFVFCFFVFAITHLCGCANMVTVTFDDGSQVDTVTLRKGDYIVFPVPQKNGYEFCGWREKSSGEMFDFSHAVFSDLTLVAEWSYSRVNVVFDSAGGDLVSTQVVEKGDCATVPDTPTNKYKNFIGWYKQGDTTVFDFSEPIFDNIVLVARWQTVNVTVYFDSVGGSVVSAQTTEKGGKIEQPQSPSKEGFDFVAWHTTDGKEFSFDTPILEDITLKAVWREKSFWVSFDSSGGTAVEKQLVKKGDKVVMPTSFRYGYVLKGWYESGVEQAFDFDLRRVDKDLVLKAVWTATDAFVGLHGEWTGKSVVQDNDEANYRLIADEYGGALLFVSRGSFSLTDNDAQILTSGETSVILLYKDGNKKCRIDFEWDGIKLTSQAAVFGEALNLSKTPDELYNPAEIAGVWRGVAEMDFFGERTKITYILDISFDGKGTLSYERNGVLTKLSIVGFSVENNLLKVEYVLFEGAEQTYAIYFRVDKDRLICEKAIFGETVVLVREA